MQSMRKIHIFILGLFILLSGCATSGLGNKDFRQSLINKKDWPKDTIQDFISGKIKLGMTKEQIFWLVGSPLYWIKYPTKEGIFESWFYECPRGASYNQMTWSYDFKDNILIGYSGNGRYFGKENIEDVRNFKK